MRNEKKAVHLFSVGNPSCLFLCSLLQVFALCLSSIYDVASSLTCLFQFNFYLRLLLSLPTLKACLLFLNLTNVGPLWPYTTLLGSFSLLTFVFISFQLKDTNSNALKPLYSSHSAPNSTLVMFDHACVHSMLCPPQKCVNLMHKTNNVLIWLQKR